MLALWATAFGLAIAGLDPAGALIALAALASGARRRTVVLYGAVVLLGTTALGAALSVLLGPELAEVDWIAVQ